MVRAMEKGRGGEGKREVGVVVVVMMGGWVGVMSTLSRGMIITYLHKYIHLIPIKRVETM